MKKSTIWAITIIMALTFAGLLYVQVMYMKNILRMRDDQFAEGVKRSLYAVTGNLEQDETQYFLEDDVARIETSVLPRYSSASGEQGGIQYSFTTPEGKKGALTLQGDLNALDPTVNLAPRQRSTHEILQEQYLKQRTLMNEVILRMISQSSTRPIAERADSGKVATYLKMELANNGLELPFEFAVVNRQGANVYRSSGYNPEQVGNDNMFVQTLFPNDTRNLMYYLKVYFPTKRDYIMSSLNYIIPAFIMTFVLLVVFVITIYLTFRQKKLTDMKNDFINNMPHEMLQESMFERQRATLKLQDVDANAIVENIIHTFKIKVEKYGGHIEAVLGAEQSIIHVDEMHFTNVIFNLLDNAVKYRREDEPLRLTVSTRDVTGGRLEVTVADNGIGIRREDLKKIFEKFYRVPTGNLHDVKGFGLGLAYVNKMVGELGGQITVESELGQGTRFIITLPLAKR